MKKYIGLDVHCKQTVFVAQDSEGKVIKKGKVKTTPEGIAELLESVGAEKETKVGLESGTQATWMSRLLSAAGMKPVVIEAREVRTKARRRYMVIGAMGLNSYPDKRLFRTRILKTALGIFSTVINC